MDTASSICCHTAPLTIWEQPVVTGKTAASQSGRQEGQKKEKKKTERKHSRVGTTRRRGGEEREHCFHRAPRPNIMKECAARVAPNQTSTTDTLPPHFLFALRWQCEKFPFQANDSLERRRRWGRSSLRAPTLRPPSGPFCSPLEK